MRVTAHSLIPSSPLQYVHIGYLSAQQSHTVSGPGWSMILFWLVLCALTIRRSVAWGLGLGFIAFFCYLCTQL